MTERDIEGLVAENRRLVRTNTAAFTEAGGTGRSGLNFARNTFTFTITIEVYKRPLNNGLLSGHPNGDKHGSGQGVAGDVRGSWSLVASSTNSAIMTDGGRNAVRDKLDIDTGAIKEAAIGTGTDDARSSDTDLTSKSAQGHATTFKSAPKKAVGQAIFGFADHENAATEFGVYDKSGRLLARVTTDDVSPTNEEEVRVAITIEPSGSGVGNSVITDEGEITVADALSAHPEEIVATDAIKLGSGTASFSKSDNSLTTQEVSKTGIRSKGIGTLKVRRIFAENTGTDVDLSEIGVFDDDGDMLWATTFSPLTWGPSFQASVSFLFS